MNTAASPITISGAGPAGLAAALTIARAGREVVVYEMRRDVGGRFHGDFQGIENYTTRGDVLEELGAAGIEPNFEFTPFREALVFDHTGREWRYRSSSPIFYIIRRGSEAGMLDASLKAQAQAAGVRIRFSESAPTGRPVIKATGPRQSFAIAVGYIFRTTLPDQISGALSDQLAPKGYAYLVISGGVGTISSCIFADMRNHQIYLDRTVEFFEKRMGLTMEQPRHFGGTGSVHPRRTARQGDSLLAGEAAGFQDALWGFGLRYAMLSGHYAARALLEAHPEDYDLRWQSRFGGHIKTAFVNRYFFERLGDAGYRAFLSRLGHAEDAREWLRGHYAPSALKSLLYHLVSRSLRSRFARVAVPA